MKNGVEKYSLAPGTVPVYSSYCLRTAVLHTVGTSNVTWNGPKPNFRGGGGGNAAVYTENNSKHPRKLCLMGVFLQEFKIDVHFFIVSN